MNVFSLFGEIAIQNAEANKAIDTTVKKADEARRQLNESFDKIGSFATKCGKAIASGLAVGTAAIGTLLKASIGEYAEYEQLVGGIETLFKDSKNKVMKYANEAYKTAGLSANDYMETVTSFSASLLQGLGGDTEAAAEIANIAITDMSDNANKMGTDMSMIQNAYQGFAKQNYTMLDNLKLGYGGTQEEMARLINDSEVLGKGFKVTAETVKNVPFHRIIEAIHVMQTEMGITGTTAKEASTTISGSFSSFKSTWKNFLTGLADGDADMSVLYGNMVEAGKTVLSNVSAVLPTIKENVAAVLGEIVQDIDNGMRTKVWPELQEVLKIKLGVDPPDWEKFKKDVTAWWTDANDFLDETFTWAFKAAGFLDFTEEDKKAIQDWAEKAVAAIGQGIGKGIGHLVTGDWFSKENVLGFVQENPEEAVQFAKTADFVNRLMGFFNPKHKADTDLAAFISGWLAPDTEENLQNELDKTDLVVDVKVNPITTWFNSLFSQGSSTYSITTGGGAGRMPTVTKNAEGAIFSKPTIFDTRLGYQMVGEAGAEAVAPISKLQQYVADAVKNTVGGMQFNVVLDTGVLVGQLAPRMDMQLGTMANRKGRG